MKNRITVLFVIIAAFGLSVLTSSCHIGCVKGSGKAISENRIINKFSKIDISGGFKINIKQDSSLTLNVTADDNLLKYIRTQVNGNKLRIYTRKNFCNNAPIVINLGVGQLEEIKASGAVELASQSRINTRNLKLDFSGASKIDMDLSAADVKTSARGATEIKLKGQAASHSVDIAGVGKLSALDFVVGNYKVNTSGSGHCQVNVLKSLITNTSGVSNIEYRGSPSTIETHKSGTSNIKKVN